MKSAVYAGTFDPTTLGHMWMIERGSKLFDKLFVAIGTDNGKSPTFTLEQRQDMLQQLTQGMNVIVEPLHNSFLVNYAVSVGATFLLRGVRDANDFSYERLLRNANGDLDETITTVFMIPPRHIADVSSSMIKSIVGLDGWQRVAGKYVPELVVGYLQEKYERIGA